jgi:hypothetical protein
MSLLLLDGTRLPVMPPAAGAFAELVSRIDRAAQAHLGGGPIVYRPAVGELVAVAGIFDAQYVLAQGDPPAGVEALGPAVFLRLEDLPGDPEHDEPTLTIGGLDYRVTERRPDGMGGIVLALRLAR